MGPKPNRMDNKDPFEVGGQSEDQLSSMAEMLKQVFEPLFGRVIDLSQYTKGGAGFSLLNPINQADQMLKNRDREAIRSESEKFGTKVTDIKAPFNSNTIFGSLLNFATQSTEDIQKIKNVFDRGLKSIGSLWDPQLVESVVGADPASQKIEAARAARVRQLNTRQENAGKVFEGLMSNYDPIFSNYSRTDLATVTSQLFKSNRGGVQSALDKGEIEKVSGQARGMTEAIASWNDLLGGDVEDTMAQLSNMFGSDVVAKFKNNSGVLQSMALNMKQVASITGTSMGEVWRSAEMAKPALQQFGMQEGPKAKQGALTIGMMSSLASMPRDMYGIDPDQFKRETVVQNAAHMQSGYSKAASGMYAAWAAQHGSEFGNDQEKMREAFKRQVAGAQAATGNNNILSADVMKKMGLGGYNRNDLANLASTRTATEFRTQDAWATNMAGLQGDENITRNLAGGTRMLASQAGVRMTDTEARKLVGMNDEERGKYLTGKFGVERGTKIQGSLAAYYNLKTGDEDKWRAQVEQRKEGMERQRLANDRAALEKELGIGGQLTGIKGVLFAAEVIADESKLDIKDPKTGKKVRDRMIKGADGKMRKMTVEDVIAMGTGLYGDEKRELIHQMQTRPGGAKGYGLNVEAAMKTVIEAAHPGEKMSPDRLKDEMSRQLSEEMDSVDKLTGVERKKAQALIIRGRTGMNASVNAEGKIVYNGVLSKDDQAKALAESRRQFTKDGYKEELAKGLEASGMSREETKKIMGDFGDSAEGLQKLEILKAASEKEKKARASGDVTEADKLKKFQTDIKSGKVTSKEGFKTDYMSDKEREDIQKRVRERGKVSTETSPTEDLLMQIMQMLKGAFDGSNPVKTENATRSG